jgi:hypothetical protein
MNLYRCMEPPAEIPNLRLSVVRSRDETPAVGAEAGMTDPFDVTQGLAQWHSSPHVPHTRGVIARSGHYTASVGAKLSEGDATFVTQLFGDRAQGLRRPASSRPCASNLTGSGNCTERTAQKAMEGFGCLMRWIASIRKRRPNGDGNGFGQRSRVHLTREPGWNAGTTCMRRICRMP